MESKEIIQYLEQRLNIHKELADKYALQGNKQQVTDCSAIALELHHIIKHIQQFTTH